MRLIALLLCVLLLGGCTAAEPAQETPAPPPAIITTPQADLPAPSAEISEETADVFDPSAYLLGFIGASSSFESKIAGHAFLRNAEGTGYPAKLYEANAVNAAIADGVRGAVVAAGVADTEIQKLLASGCKVVAHREGTGADVSLYTDEADYCAEAARAMGEELIARKLIGGVAVIADPETIEAADAFAESFSGSYPQYSVHVQSVPLAEAERSAMIPSLAGVFCLIPEAAGAWTAAKDAAAEALTPSATPRTATPRPSPTPEDAAPTPVPTLAPHAAAGSIVVIATDYTEENLALLDGGGVFAIAARPYFDASAQGMLLLDRLLRGVQVADRLRLNVPIVKKANIEKYRSIVDEALAWMGGE